MGCSLEDATLPTLLACLSKAAVEGVALDLNVPVQPTGKATRGAVVARVGEGRWIYPPALFATGEAATEPARPGRDVALDHYDEAGEAAPEDGVGRDHTDEDAGIGVGGDETEAEAPPPDDTPEVNELPAVPVRRSGSRKHSDEARTAA